MRWALALIATTALTGCQWRTTETRITEVDGREFVCTYTLNHLSGNESESVCTPLRATP